MCLATIPADRSRKVKKVSGRASESDHTLISDVLTADQSPSRHGGVRVWPRARGVVLNTGICISGRPHSTHTTHTKSGPQSTTRHLSEDTGDSLIVIQAAGSAALAPSGARTGVGPRPDSSLQLRSIRPSGITNLASSRYSLTARISQSLAQDHTVTYDGPQPPLVQAGLLALAPGRRSRHRTNAYACSKQQVVVATSADAGHGGRHAFFNSCFSESDLQTPHSAPARTKARPRNPHLATAHHEP